MPNTAKPPILRIEDLAVGYGGEKLLEHISFEVSPGEVVVVLGGSGCGKSTLMKHIIGLYQPLAGKVWLGGSDFSHASEADRRALLRRIGVMYQSGALFGSMTLLENVRLPLEEFTNLPREARDLLARMKLDLVGLRDFADYLPSQISGGMQKRAAIARAMALDPDILFLDEPSAGLDPVTSAGLDQLILRLSRNLGMAFLVVSHELASIFTIADKAIMLDREARGVIASGPPARLRDESPLPQVRQFFLREAPKPSNASAAASASLRVASLAPALSKSP